MALLYSYLNHIYLIYINVLNLMVFYLIKKSKLGCSVLGQILYILYINDLPNISTLFI